MCTRKGRVLYMYRVLFASSEFSLWTHLGPEMHVIICTLNFGKRHEVSCYSYKRKPLLLTLVLAFSLVSFFSVGLGHCFYFF